MDKVKRKRLNVSYKKMYVQSAVEKALTAIKDGMSIRTATRTYAVPRSTLQAKKSNILSNILFLYEWLTCIMQYYMILTN